VVYSFSKVQAAARFMEDFLWPPAWGCKAAAEMGRTIGFFGKVSTTGVAESSQEMVVAFKAG